MRIKFDYLLPPEVMDHAVRNPNDWCISQVKLIITPEDPKDRAALLAWARKAPIPCVIDSKSQVIMPDNEGTNLWSSLPFKKLECLKRGSLTTDELQPFWDSLCIGNPVTRDMYLPICKTPAHITVARIIDMITGFGGLDEYRQRDRLPGYVRDRPGFFAEMQARNDAERRASAQKFSAGSPPSSSGSRGPSGPR